MKSLHNRVNIVPVISKADTLTKAEISRLKKRILDEIAKHNIKIYQLPDVEEDEEEDYKEQTRVLKVCFSILYSENNTKKHFLVLKSIDAVYFRLSEFL